MITVTVAYATPERQLEIPISVEPNCTAAMAIKKSGIMKEFPDINLATAVIGIHSKKVMIDASLRDKDRIEIYRPLTMDPKQARLLRAKNKGV